MELRSRGLQQGSIHEPIQHDPKAAGFSTSFVSKGRLIRVVHGAPGEPRCLCYLMVLMVFAEGGSISTSIISSSSKYSS